MLYGESDELGLLESFEEVSSIATKTKLNVDDMPSTVNVLKSSQLRQLGINNLAEALAILPGIEMDRTPIGWKTTVIRGIKNPEGYVFDKIKLMIDGVDVGSALHGTVEYYLDFPVELIERIEVLKGPGSALYGTGAYAGVINVVTRNAEERSGTFFGGVGSFDYRLAGLHASYLDSGTYLGLDGYYQTNNKHLDAKGFPREPNRFEGEEKSDEAFNDYSLGLYARLQHLSFRARTKKNESGNFYGINEGLEEGDNDEGNTRQSHFAELEYELPLFARSSIDFKAGWKYFKLDLTASVQMDQEAYDVFNTPLTEALVSITDLLGLSGDDYIAYFDYDENRYYGDMALKYRELEGHDIVLGLCYSTLSLGANRYYADGLTQGNVYIIELLNDLLGTSLMAIDDVLIKEDPERQIRAVYFNDLYSFSDSVAFQVGLRLDDYKDEFSLPSYKLGMIYRYSDRINTKFSYGKSFRAPSLWELYLHQNVINAGADNSGGNPDLDPETIDSYEANFIYNDRFQNSFALNLYYSVLNDVIDVSRSYYGGPYYTNYDERISKGVEVEYTNHFPGGNELGLSYAHNITDYDSIRGDDASQDMPGVSKDMFKAYYLYLLDSSSSLALRYTYYGPQEANIMSEAPEDRADYEKEYPANSSFDLTYAYNSDAWQLYLSVYNLFDEKIVDPSYNNAHPESGQVREGRHFMGKVRIPF
jgi:iron complex outermembrane receptor protein